MKPSVVKRSVVMDSVPIVREEAGIVRHVNSNDPQSDPDTPEPANPEHVKPDQVDPETGTGPDGMPVENPSG